MLGLVLKPLIRNLPGLIRDKSLKFVKLTVLTDLGRRDQIQGWDLPADLGLDADDVRLVLLSCSSRSRFGRRPGKTRRTGGSIRS